MVYNETASNPMLVGCMQLLAAENTPEHRQMFVEEVEKAVLMAPAIISNAPVTTESGEKTLESGTRINFITVPTRDGKKYLMGFTDMVEYKKWVEVAKAEDVPYFTLTFEDYANMLLRPDNQGASATHGYVINCCSANAVIPKELVAQTMAFRAGMFHATTIQTPDDPEEDTDEV